MWWKWKKNHGCWLIWLECEQENGCSYMTRANIIIRVKIAFHHRHNGLVTPATNNSIPSHNIHSIKLTDLLIHLLHSRVYSSYTTKKSNSKKNFRNFFHYIIIIIMTWWNGIQYFIHDIFAMLLMSVEN